MKRTRSRQRILGLILLLPLTVELAAQKTTQAKAPFVRVRWSSSILHITYQAKRIDFELDNVADDGRRPEYQSLLFYTIEKLRTRRLLEKNGIVYMLLDVEGPSRTPEEANVHCGAGTEKALVLFRFNSEGLQDAPTRLLYESCWMTINADDSPEESGSDTLTSMQPYVKVLSFTRMHGPPNPHDVDVNRDQVTVEARFDPLHPELGLVAREKVQALKPAPPKPN